MSNTIGLLLNPRTAHKGSHGSCATPANDGLLLDASRKHVKQGVGLWSNVILYYDNIIIFIEAPLPSKYTYQLEKHEALPIPLSARRRPDRYALSLHLAATIAPSFQLEHTAGHSHEMSPHQETNKQCRSPFSPGIECLLCQVL